MRQIQKISTGLFFIILLIFSNSLSAQDPYPGTASEFDGVDDYIEVNASLIPPSGSFTISVWAKAFSLTGSYIEILSQSGGTGTHFYIGKSVNGNIRAGDDWGITDVPFPQDGLWHHYTLVKDSVNTYIYLDGFLRASRGDTIENPAGSEFRIARQYGAWEEYFHGVIDEIRIWGRALSAREIREKMHLTLDGIENGLISYWQFNEAAGDTTYDLVGGQDGVLNNMESDDWETSTVPVGGGSSYTQVVSSTGIFDFNETNLSMIFSEKTGTDTIVVSKLDLSPITGPTLPETFDNQYWIVNKFGSGDFTANLTFSPNEVISPEDETSPEGLQLFNRANNSDSCWSMMMAGSAASAFNNMVTFDGITSFSQFLLGRSWFTDIGAGLSEVRYSSVAWGDYDNDGDLDILYTGYTNTSSSSISIIYRNDEGVFTDIEAGLTEVQSSSVAWGDYDNDGDLDILLSGGATGSLISCIYRNDDGVFSDIEAGLTGVYIGSIAWGDYDNDGDLDILLTGTIGASHISRIYRNDNGVFTDIDAGLTGVYTSLSAWEDYDNDGDLDILLSGATGSSYISSIYCNDSGIFTDIDAGLTGIYNGSVAWGDYDNDGDPDILLAGISDSSGFISRVYRNDDGVFTDIKAGLTGVFYCSAAWGDYDNDGDLDILLAGRRANNDCISRIYRNDDGIFADIEAGLTGIHHGSVAWGDYDNDGDLDILLTGMDGSYSLYSYIYRNNCISSNTSPSSPSALTAVVSADSINFSWNKAGDTETAQEGLSYNLVLGNSKHDMFIKPPMAELNNGRRLIPATGNIGQPNSWKWCITPFYYYPQVITPDYWGVQAVDHTFAGSPFAIDSINIPINNLHTINTSVMQISDTLAWEIVHGDFVESYIVQIDDDINFDDCMINDTLFLSTGDSGYYSIHLQYIYGTHNLVEGTKYYWRMKPVYTFGLATANTDPAPSFWFGHESAIKDETDLALPKEFALQQNYPNPFNPETKISFDVKELASVLLKIYTVSGQLVSTPIDKKMQPGRYTFTFIAGDIASGIYFYHIQMGNYQSVKKMILVK